MPSTSTKQRNFFQIVLQVKTHKMKRTEVDKKVLDIVDSDMTLQEIKDMASTTDKEIEKAEKKTNESLNSDDKGKIKTFIKSFKGAFDDSEVHGFAKKHDLNIHEVEAYVYELARELLSEDRVPGGKGDDTDVSTLYKNELAVGIEVEMEHTTDRKIAIEIAMDHLKEVPNYYTRLIKSGLVDENPALDLYKKLFNDDPSKYIKEAANQLNPSTVNGMGEVTLPESPGGTTKFSSQETGSGDNPILNKKKKKKKRKMLYINNYDSFSGNKNT